MQDKAIKDLEQLLNDIKGLDEVTLNSDDISTLVRGFNHLEAEVTARDKTIESIRSVSKKVIDSLKVQL